MENESRFRPLCYGEGGVCSAGISTKPSISGSLAPRERSIAEGGSDWVWGGDVSHLPLNQGLSHV